ncbi:MAG: hypothetical protein ACI841_003872 [Planctomycetota bacterium]|jgi:hypothetical protein
MLSGSADAAQEEPAVIVVKDKESTQDKLKRLARKCATELEWADNWKQAAERARTEDRFVLTYVRAYPGFQMSNDTFASTFMDGDVEPLIKRRYIPLLWTPGMPAPFVEADGYGMGGSTFGEAFLIVDPEGQVLSEIAGSAFKPAFLEFLLKGVEDLPEPEASGSSGPNSNSLSDPATRAQELLLAGELERAEQLVNGDDSWRADWVRASLSRRRLHGEVSLASFASALASCPDTERGAIELERAAVLIGLGKTEEAEAVFRSHRAHAGAIGAEAAVQLGLIHLARAEHDLAKAIWHEVVDQHEDSRWSWIAAATLTSTALDHTQGFPLTWPTEEALRAARMAEAEPWAIGRAREAHQQALDYLLSQQTEAGAWLCGGDTATQEGPPNRLSLGVTSIAAESLLPHRLDPKVKRALSRGLDNVLATWERSKADESPKFFMDYQVWSNAYMLSFLGACVGDRFGNHDQLREVMAEVVADLEERQKSGGGWSYYLTSDLDSDADPYDISMSFTTAAILIGLHRAQEAGVTVPESVLGAALGCLERMRNPNGTYIYMMNHVAESAGRASGEGGAAGRGPVCALARYLHGRSDRDELRLTLDMFARNKEGLARERRKSLMHCGVEAQGSHYVFFDYMTTAAAIAALPEQEREEYRRMLLGEILASRNVDGSFIGNSFIGPSFGTAAAIRSLHQLQ